MLGTSRIAYAGVLGRHFPLLYWRAKMSDPPGALYIQRARITAYTVRPLHHVPVDPSTELKDHWMTTMGDWRTWRRSKPVPIHRHCGELGLYHAVQGLAHPLTTLTRLCSPWIVELVWIQPVEAVPAECVTGFFSLCGYNRQWHSIWNLCQTWLVVERLFSFIVCGLIFNLIKNWSDQKAISHQSVVYNECSTSGN